MDHKYRITNMHGLPIYEGWAKSYWQAWQIMFTECGYPAYERNIVKEINQGMWIERID